MKHSPEFASTIWFISKCIQINGTDFFIYPTLLDDMEYDDEEMSILNQSGHLFNNEGFLLFYDNNPSYYSLNYRVIGTFFQALILFFGLLGNLLVVVVVFRTRSMHSPTNCKPISLIINVVCKLGCNNLYKRIKEC